MKVQNLAIIFLVISIPLVMILSYYLSLQQKTLSLQAEYDTKLAEATKEGIKAFEVNTVDWADWVSEVSSQKIRNNVQAVVNTFITSLANNLHVSGTAKEFMLNYIPAVAVTMYDGYYIYAPTYTPISANNDDGVQLFYDTTSGGANKATTSDEGEILYEAAEEGKTYYYTYTNEFMETETQEYSNLTTDITKAKMEHRNILNNKISYSGRYATTTNSTNVLINYTLDNRIYVYGTVNNEAVNKNGYLVYFDNNNVLPRITVDANAKNESNIHVQESVAKTIYSKKIGDSISRKTEIEPEILTEQILYKKEIDEKYRLQTFKYIYDIQNEKLYYDEEVENFFTLNDDKTQNFIPNSLEIKAGKDKCRYKSVSVLLGYGETTEFKKIYQVLNGKDKGKWYIDIKEDSEEAKLAEIEEIDTEITEINKAKLGLVYLGDIQGICRDYSDISYYVEAYAFTNWVKQNLGNKNLKQLTVDYDETSGEHYANSKDIEEGNIFNIKMDNDPEKEFSSIVQHKRRLMKKSITSNLILSLSNYNANGKYDFKLPMLTDSDWNQIFSNISLITFFQGVPIGLKTYNNYAIATSTTNREYVDPGELYFSGPDANYHRVYCEKCGNQTYIGYRSVEYVQREYTATLADGTNNTTYYYQHDNGGDTNSEIACYYCTINKSNYKQSTDLDTLYKQAKSYNEALARERYYQKQIIQGKLVITITYHAGKEVKDHITKVVNVLESTNGVQETLPEKQTQITTEIPSVETDDGRVYDFIGWALPEHSSAADETIDYNSGQMAVFYDDVDLYGKWKLNMSSLKWHKDFAWAKGENDTSAPDPAGPDNISIIKIDKKNNVKMYGNGTNPGKGAAWLDWQYDDINIIKLSFDYNIDFGDSFTAAGILFDISDSNPDNEHSGTLTGYMLSFNNKAARGVCTNDGEKFRKTNENGNATLWKFTYEKGDNKNNINKLDRIAALNISKQGKMAIKVTDSSYEINVNNGQFTKTLDNTGGTATRNSLGFFTDHYPHGCNLCGYFEISNFDLTPEEIE